MERLWKTDGDYCMLVVRLVAGVLFALHGVRVSVSLLQAHGQALFLAGGAMEFVGALALMAGLLARLSAGALLLDAAAGLFAFGNYGRGVDFYVLAGAVLWLVVVHGAGPWSVDSWLTRHVAVKRI